MSIFENCGRDFVLPCLIDLEVLKKWHCCEFSRGKCSNNHFCSKCWISSGFSISKSQVKSSQYQGDWHGTKLENLWVKRSPRSKTRIKNGSFKHRLSSCIIMYHLIGWSSFTKNGIVGASMHTSFFDAPKIPVVPHKAVAEVSKIGNL